jgi:hypothetical protein
LLSGDARRRPEQLLLLQTRPPSSQQSRQSAVQTRTLGAEAKRRRGADWSAGLEARADQLQAQVRGQSIVLVMEAAAAEEVEAVGGEQARAAASAATEAAKARAVTARAAQQHWRLWVTEAAVLAQSLDCSAAEIAAVVD